MINAMAIWNRNKIYQNEILSGKELSAWIKERKQENGYIAPDPSQVQRWYERPIIPKYIAPDTSNDTSYYYIGFWITAVISFIACWIYAIASWGFLLGVGLGWIPSLFIAAIAGFIWPLLALVLIVGLFIIAYFLLYKN
jgi:hypothetical protein